ncbi:expressed protein [Phakopsora pachyrhizi]|uniref:Expressed protein n=1 Tax=Phakopsora pachyrhizi TaxID=170000 RepID=A0AAV0BP37_PHAPC|nr:expressed protein [Phakopsora pachyrhizi]
MNLSYHEKNLKNFIKCTFSYHVQNYLKRYKDENFKLEIVEEQKTKFFESFFKVFKNILKFINLLEDSINFGKGSRRIISYLPFIFELKNLMPLPDSNDKDWFIGHEKELLIKTIKSNYSLKYSFIESNKSNSSNFSEVLRTLKHEYVKLTRQMITSLEYGPEFNKKAIDSWYSTIYVYINFLDNILKEICKEEETLEYFGLSKTDHCSFFDEF